MPWEATEQLKTHKPDLQQIPYNLTGEEDKEEQEKEVNLFSGDGEKHRTPKM